MRFPLALTLAALTLTAAHAQTPAPKLYAIPSWGDYTVVYGPGTDPAMDNPAAMENMIRFWKGRGYAGVFLRSDLQQFEPYVRRNPRVQMNPGLALLWRHIDVQAEHYDYVAAAQQAADKHGFELWVYHPHIYSDGAPEDVGVEGVGRMIPWSYVTKWLYEHPETVSIDRQGRKYWMVPEYAYPGARRAKVAEFVHMAKKYGVKRFIPNMRSEVNQLIDPADHADRFGFNQPVVDDMRRLHGVDILTDPRFDVDSPSFNPRDPLVEKWRDLRGGYLTQLFRELRQGLREVDPQIKIAITLAGEHIGPPLGNWRTDWRTWIDEGLVDYLVTPVFFEATLDPDARKKGYLTNMLAGVGTVSHQTLRAYIDQSKHPEIELIATGGPPYFFTPPNAPPGATGLQCDVWNSSYQLAWFQRWEQQWMRDLREFGHLKFIEQNFDSVSPESFAGQAGSWGLLSYDPKTRACPAGWWRLGTGTDARPVAQSAVRRGTQGQAIRLTRSATGGDTLAAWHNSTPDRSRPTAAIDTSITNGLCTFSFWLHRASPESALTAYLQGDGTETDVALRSVPGSGKIAYASGTPMRWTETTHALSVGQWEKLTIRVNLDQRHYSATLGDAEPRALCDAIPLVMPKERFTEVHGVNVPIPVPAYKQFQRLSFAPEGAAGSVTYLDDVSVHWQPTLHFLPRGASVEFADDFEGNSTWSFEPSTPVPAFTVTAGISYGAGVKSLHSTGGVRAVAALRQPVDLAKPLLVDLDLFIRSSSSFPHLIPSLATKSPHRTTIALTRPDGSILAGLKAGEGTWQIWNGREWTDTAVRIDYDVWNHLQLALTGDGACHAAVQPVGQVPFPIGKAQLPSPGSAETLKLMIEPSATPGHITCYDNVLVTSGQPAR